MPVSGRWMVWLPNIESIQTAKQLFHYQLAYNAVIIGTQTIGHCTLAIKGAAIAMTSMSTTQTTVFLRFGALTVYRRFASETSFFLVLSEDTNTVFCLLVKFCVVFNMSPIGYIIYRELLVFQPFFTRHFACPTCRWFAQLAVETTCLSWHCVLWSCYLFQCI